MLLKNKNAIFYDAAGSIGGMVARAFAREGARAFLAGRTATDLEKVAKCIAASSGNDGDDFGQDVGATDTVTRRGW